MDPGNHTVVRQANRALHAKLANPSIHKGLSQVSDLQAGDVVQLDRTQPCHNLII
jgi:hypothetical protein